MRVRVDRRGVGNAVALAVLVLIVAACAEVPRSGDEQGGGAAGSEQTAGRGQDEASSSPPALPEATGTDDATPDVPAPGDTDQPNAPDRPAPDLPGPPDPDTTEPDTAPVLAWLPIGPASPSDPPPNFWFARLADRDCEIPVDSSTGAGQLWIAALSVCRALAGGDDAAWATAASDFHSASRPADCLEGAVFDALERALGFHRQFPAAQPELAPASGTACAPVLTGYVDEFGLPGPRCVPVTGVAEVRLTGRIAAAGPVLVGDTSVQMREVEANNYVIPIPPRAPGLVSVTAPGLEGTFELNYVTDPSSECPG